MDSTLYILKQWGVKRIKVMSLIATNFGATVDAVAYFCLCMTTLLRSVPTCSSEEVDQGLPGGLLLRRCS